MQFRRMSSEESRREASVSVLSFSGSFTHRAPQEYKRAPLAVYILAVWRVELPQSSFEESPREADISIYPPPGVLLIVHPKNINYL